MTRLFTLRALLGVSLVVLASSCMYKRRALAPLNKCDIEPLQSCPPPGCSEADVLGLACSLDSGTTGECARISGKIDCQTLGDALFDGHRCSSANACASGHCADGICCESSCDGICVQCDAHGSEGLCTKVPAGESAGGACDDNPCLTGQCDGDGGCTTLPAGTTCDDTGVCNEMGECELQGAPVVVSSDGPNTSLLYEHQRKGFYAAGQYFYFYRDGDTLTYVSSADGTTWRTPVAVPEAELQSAPPSQLSVYFDGTYAHYTTGGLENGSTVRYRRGEPLSDGSIAWSASEQTARPGYSTGAREFPCVASTHDEYIPWIGYSIRDTSIYKEPAITRSSSTDGSWETALNYPFDLSQEYAVYHVAPVPRPNATRRVLIIYAGGDRIDGRHYNSGEWFTILGICAPNSGCTADFAAVAVKSDVHVVFRRDNGSLWHRIRTQGNWEEQIQVADNASAFTLSADEQSTHAFIYWADGESIRYRVRDSSDWIASEATCVRESRSGLTGGISAIRLNPPAGGAVFYAVPTVSARSDTQTIKLAICR